MAAHTEEQFEKFMSQLQETNATLGFYSDFTKISKNVADIAISLNMLNFLIGQKDLRGAVEALWKRDPHVFDVMDILIATRKKDKKMFFDGHKFRTVHSLFSSVDGVMEFLVGTGFDKVLQKPEIKDLVDYVFGVETGLDSNGRKNRSGEFTETIVANLFAKAGVAYREQVSSNEFPAIAKVLGADQKVFDFMVKAKGKTYLIEVNFYSGGGSKLNEVARSYTDIAPKINAVPRFEFVWITDGIGWRKAKNKLQEAYSIIPSIYNLTNIHDFLSRL